MVSAREKQATFTGADQRAGVYVLPFAVAGIFGRGRPRPAKAVNAGDAETTAPAGARSQLAGRRRRKGGSARARAASRNKPSGAHAAKAHRFERGEVFGGNDEDDDEELPAGFKFDWDAYRAAFGDTPIEDAVTVMFSEYAALYARIVGWTTSFKPAPMSLEEGQSIQEQASNFVHSIMTPLLGYVHTSKVHKLLAHLMDSIRYHGNLNNANTSANEAAHKADKKFYRRTNMEIATFTEQLVRQAQGAREVVRRHDAADAATLLSHPRVAADAAVTTGGILAAATGGSGVAPTSGGGAALPGVSGVVPPSGSGAAPPGGSGAMPPGGGGAAPPGGSGAEPAGGFGPASPNNIGAALPGG